MKFKKFWILIALFLTVSSPAYAQETPSHECQYIGNDVIQILLSVFGGGASSTALCPSNNINLPDLENFYNQVREAADRINALPDDIENATNGVDISQMVAGVSQIAGYVKWLFSPNSAQELLGKTFAPIGINILVYFLAVVALTTIYVSINVAVFIIRMIVWLMNQILKILPFW